MHSVVIAWCNVKCKSHAHHHSEAPRNRNADPKFSSKRAMNDFVWVTDPHLNHCDRDQIIAFFDLINAQQPKALWITGDFSESTHLFGFLHEFVHAISCPIYFVLGNHDFYFGSIHRIRQQVEEFCLATPNAVYLTGAQPVQLNEGLALIGDDGWADGRIGDYERSTVMMHDYKLIEELKDVSKEQRWTLLKGLGDAAAKRVEMALSEALQLADHVVLLTHVPPLREACWHEGRISDDEWAPHFTCQAIGDVILEVMFARPDKQLTVLCGHTHGGGTTEPATNIKIFTGPAEYGSPGITGIFDQEAKRIR